MSGMEGLRLFLDFLSVGSVERPVLTYGYQAASHLRCVCVCVVFEILDHSELFLKISK